ncbi:MAG: MYG1 family protein [Proteobacteria bacterium]|nr:MYG1 family protein [Pseudomonadota bacterium]
MPKTLIITHPGSAHFDEFFAISLIIAINDDVEFHIDRRDPAPDELKNPTVWVVDIGGEYNPHLKNFDHHQNLEIPASFMIVADFLGVSSKLSVLPWWAYKDRIDRFGPIRVGEDMGTGNLVATYSPFEEWYLEYFSKQPDACRDVMKAFGKCILEKADELSSGINYWKNAKRIQVKQKTCLLGETNDLTGAEEYLTRVGIPFSITVSHDKRGEGWTLKRYHDDPEVDFSKVSDHKDIKFAHKGGFIAKTRTRLALDKVIEIVDLAVS